MIEIVEVGPRDGLQNEKAVISVAEKAELIRKCAAAGLSKIEVGAFVNEARVPQMAASGEVIGEVGELPGVSGLVLIPNARRLGEFLKAREAAAFDVPEIAVFVSATEEFSQANLGCTVTESLERVLRIFDALPASGVAVRGYISCVTDCPFEGHVNPDAVGRLSCALRDAGCDTLALADTIGKGTPERVRPMLDAALEHWEPSQVVAHFHDTVGLALANVDVALDRGLSRFDSSVAGLGGCPYAPGAPGNLATEALVMHLEALGHKTGIDKVALADAAAYALKIVGR
ncbi:MAG: hydroxymethylglutaryl-CoA lyase [Pseudomonadota bacterium]